MREEGVSARGVFYDLEKSPYKFNYKDLELKFSSRKKLEVFTKKFNDAKIRIDNFIYTFSSFETWRDKMLINTAKDIYKSMRRV